MCCDGDERVEGSQLLSRRTAPPPPEPLHLAHVWCAWCRVIRDVSCDGGTYLRCDAMPSRGVYERALAELSDSEKTEKLFSAFAHFEERCKEFDRAR